MIPVTNAVSLDAFASYDRLTGGLPERGDADQFTAGLRITYAFGLEWPGSCFLDNDPPPEAGAGWSVPPRLPPLSHHQPPLAMRLRGGLLT